VVVEFDGGEELPLFRAFLLLFQFLFVLGASSCLHDYDEILRLVVLYVKSFFVSLIIGYVFYLGFHLDVIPLSWIEHFSVLTQFGYGFLRFSPGSYPNEYGMVSSFVLSILTWMLLEYKTQRIKDFFSKRFLILFYVLTFIALFLTTTRTAYLSYLFVLCYMAWKKRRLVRVFIVVSTCFLVVALLMRFAGINMLEVLVSGFKLDILASGSLADRFGLWTRAYEMFFENPLFGEGFSAHTNIHNLYLQLLFELGIAGVGFLLGVCSLFLFEKGYIRFFGRKANEVPFEVGFLKTIAIAGAIQILWFAGSNHNLNHHLTWLVVFLCFSLTFLKARKEQSSDAIPKLIKD
jgi:O-antigen ligase